MNPVPGKSITVRFSKNIITILLVFFIAVVGSTLIIELIKIERLDKVELKQKAESTLHIIELKLASLANAVARTSSSSLSINSLVDIGSRYSYFKFSLDDLTYDSFIEQAAVFNYAGELLAASGEDEPVWFSRKLVSSTISLGKGHLLLDQDYLYIVEPINYYQTTQGGIVARVDIRRLVASSVAKNVDLYALQLADDWQQTNMSADFSGAKQIANSEQSTLLAKYQPRLTVAKRPRGIIETIGPWLVDISIIGVLGMVAMLFFARRLGNKMAAPIIQLTQRINEGCYPVSPTQTNDELEILAEAFDKATFETQTANAEKVEAERRDKQSRLRAIVDTVVDGIITIDSSAVIETFNPAAEGIFGYKANEVVGESFKQLMPESFRAEHDRYIAEYLENGTLKESGMRREVLGKRKNGDTFPMEIALSEMYVAGKQLFTGIMRDITLRKEAESLKSEFVSTVSHELRTPLTSIRGALGLIIAKGGDQLPQKLQKMLEVAHRNSEQLTLLINDILDLEKLESGKLKFDYANEDLVSLIQRSLEDNEGFANKHKVRLLFDTSLKQAMVSADVNRLLQVMANLLSNAIKFSPENETVRVTLKQEEALFSIAVKDHGPGIPLTFRDHIFQRFAQADSSDTREKGGTGLGLSITKMIVERHCGSIGFDSRVGVETTFYIQLPMLESIESGAVAATVDTRISENDSDLSQWQRPLILHVESDLDVIDIVGGVLETLADISEARTLQSAKQQLASQHFDLILIDLDMPDGSGLDFIKALSEGSPPVVVFTAHSLESDIGDHVKAAVIKSAISNQQLEGTVRRILNSKTFNMKRK